MDGLNRSDAKPEHAADLDDEIIDLTQVVADDDEDIIELTDVLTQPDQAAGDDAAADDDVIPLVDVIQPEPLEAGSTDTEAEAVIDLTDIAPIAEPEAPFEAPGIELSELEAAPEATATAAPMAAAAAVDADDAVIDLMDVAGAEETLVAETEETPLVDDEPADAAPEAETIIDAMMPAAAPIIEAAEERDGSIAAAVWPAAETPGEKADAGPVPAPPALSDEQVTAALERVIEKVYGDRIEALLVDTIEKTVRREIEKIRNALLAEDDRSID